MLRERALSSQGQSELCTKESLPVKTMSVLYQGVARVVPVSKNEGRKGGREEGKERRE